MRTTMPRIERRLRALPYACLLALMLACAHGGPPSSSSSPATTSASTGATTFAVTKDLAEAEASVAIIRRLAAHQDVPDSLWTRLHATAGYRRLGDREHAMKRAFDDALFRAFLESDTLLARSRDLERAVERWTQVDVSAAARRAAAYLPDGHALRATLYPVIKPKTNSFVWELASDPAFFVYVDPTISAAEQENTVAHELHHVGDAAVCGHATFRVSTSDSSARVNRALTWAGAFSEGLAMLAAAGGLEHHPHEASADSVRRRWDRDVANAASDMAQLSSFFARTLDGTLATDDTVAAEAQRFYGTQGPWYTVGYVMARAIETAYGRERLRAVTCDPARMLAAYDSAAVALNARGFDPYAERAGKLPWPLPRWPAALLAKLGATPAR